MASRATALATMAPKIDGRGLAAEVATRAVEGGKVGKMAGIGVPRRPQWAGGATACGFLLRTAHVSSVPTDASHTARAAMSRAAEPFSLFVTPMTSAICLT